MNHDMIGFQYAPSEPFVVTAESIKAFAQALGDDNPAYSDASAAHALGHENVVAPPTYPIVVTMSAMENSFHDPALNMNYSRVVHSDQRFEYVRPIRVGDELVVTTIVEDIRTMAGNDMATFRTEVASGGDIVVTTWSKLVVRGDDA